MKGFTNIGPVIRKLRMTQKIGQQEFAARIGESASNLNHIEKGRRRVTLAMLDKIGPALGCGEAAIVLMWLSFRYPELLHPETIKQVDDLVKGLSIEPKRI